ncbi:hypothetical protein N9878_00840 [bacterium]|nr:hypothetical protein [bacterium]
MKLTAYVGIDCTTGGEVEGDTLEGCIEKAWDEFGSPFVCHHCSSGMDVGDATSLMLIDENGGEVYEDSPSADDAKRVKGMIDYIEELKAEIVKLKEAAQ